MKVVFQSPITKIWYCVFTKHIECDGRKIRVLDKEGCWLTAYDGDDALAQFEHFIEYGKIFNAHN